MAGVGIAIEGVGVGVWVNNTDITMFYVVTAATYDIDTFDFILVMCV